MRVVALFSGFVLVSRIGFVSALTLPNLAALRFGIGAIVMSPVLLRHGLSGLRLRQALLLALLGGLGFALFAYAGFSLAPAAHGATMLHGTLSLTTALLLAVVLREGVERSRLMALSLIALGVVAMALEGVAQLSGSLVVGDMCLLAASTLWSGYGIYAKRLRIPAVRSGAIVVCISAAIFMPVYAFLPDTRITSARWGDILFQGLFKGAFIGAVSVVVYTRAVSLLGERDVAYFTALVPVVTIICSTVLLGEQAGYLTVVGLVLVSGGMIAGLTALRRQTHKLEAIAVEASCNVMPEPPLLMGSPTAAHFAESIQTSNVTNQLGIR